MKSSQTPPSQDALWREIEQRLLDFRIAIFGTRFATAEQAVGIPALDDDGKRILKKNNPSWIDLETGPVTPWLQIPFDDKRKLGEWEELREVAKALSEEVEAMLSQRVLQPKFILARGRLSAIGRLFEDAWSSDERISAATKGSAS